jgi:hypothetical protein
MTSKEYQRKSGYNLVHKYKIKRRNENKGLEDAISQLSKTIKKTCRYSVFVDYLKIFAKHFNLLKDECTDLTAKKKKWNASRARQSCLKNIANSLFNKTGTKNVKEKSAYRKLSNEERYKLRVEMRNRINEKKRIVMFGNGSFKAGIKGNVAMPRKAFVKELSTVGLTFVVDEFRTSKTCPGCGSDMVDVEESDRVRRCTNVTEDVTTSCCLAVDKDCFTCDRDQSASVNMMLCAYQAITSNTRPKHLCRKDKKIVKIKETEESSVALKAL